MGRGWPAGGGTCPPAAAAAAAEDAAAAAAAAGEVIPSRLKLTRRSWTAGKMVHRAFWFIIPDRAMNLAK